MVSLGYAGQETQYVRFDKPSTGNSMILTVIR